MTREKGLEGNSGQELSCNAKSGLHGISELPSMLSNFSSIMFLKGGREVSSVKCYPILFLLLWKTASIDFSFPKQMDFSLNL